MMPTDLEGDPVCMRKKAHIGNDFVNVIWNDSGSDFQFNTFPSDFNYVYIVISPEVSTSFITQRKRVERDIPPDTILDPNVPEEAFSSTSTPLYKVQVLSCPGLPSISPAAEPKMISAEALAPFVRLLALNASFFSLVWSNREGGEHISPWRNRLREIKKLREKYCNHHDTSHPGTEAISSPTMSAGAGSRASGLLQLPAGGRLSQRTSMSFGGVLDGGH